MSSFLGGIHLLPPLEETINQLIGPLEIVQRQIHEDEGGDLPNGLTLLMGELTMVALIFINADFNVSEKETDILNDFRRAIYSTNLLLLLRKTTVSFVAGS